MIDVHYSFAVTDRDGQHACSLDVSMAAYCHATSRPTTDDVAAYIPHLLRYQHDKLREYLHTATQWMGITPLLLELPHDLVEMTSPGSSLPPRR